MIKDLLHSIVQNADRHAFCINDRYYTYGELGNYVAAVQQEIEGSLGGKKQCNIAVIASNDIGTYASLLAIWFSGCAYVPLGLHNPVERNLTILESADAEIIIAAGVALDDRRYKHFRIIRPALESVDGERAIRCSEAADSALAYVLFTSGSTGAPKGVPISHGNLSCFIRAFLSSPFEIDREDRCLQMFELTFDVSVSSYLPALLKGACVYTVPNDGIKYMHVLRVMTQYRLTSVQMVPSVIKLAKKLLNRISIPEVKRCILTGEATMVDLLELWLPCVPNASIFNFYGPTESTIYCSFLQYAEARPKSYNGMLAIGKSLKGMDLLIVNDLGDEASPNEKGELLIGGPQVTAGYLKNESKNKESFVSRSINGEPKSFYRSGDMCYRDEDGEIFYCGRFDNQVKIQGFRIELSEIEFLVRKQFGVNNVVIVEENEQGVTKLLLVIESQLNEDITKIIAYLKDKLPDYMVPGVTNSMEEFPLNSSGKTDRKKIKEILSGSLTA